MESCHGRESLGRPLEIALDLGDYLWADLDGGRVWRSDLDGSNRTDIITGLDQPRSLAFVAGVLSGL
jgi:hypothetical protein